MYPSPQRARTMNRSLLNYAIALVVIPIALLLIGGPRSDTAQSTGTRSRHPVPFGDLLSKCATAAGRGELHQAADDREDFLTPDRDSGRQAVGFLSRRGVPPALPRATSESVVHRHQRQAEAGGAQETVPRHLH